MDSNMARFSNMTMLHLGHYMSPASARTRSTPVEVDERRRAVPLWKWTRDGAHVVVLPRLTGATAALTYDQCRCLLLLSHIWSMSWN